MIPHVLLTQKGVGDLVARPCPQAQRAPFLMADGIRNPAQALSGERYAE